MRDRGVGHMRHGGLMLPWSRSTVRGLLLVGDRRAVAREGAVRVGEGNMRAADSRTAIGDMVLRADGETGRRVVLGLMQESVVRERVVPVAVIPQPVGLAMRQVRAAFDVDGVGDVVVARVEVAAVVVVGVADRHCP